MKFLQSKVYLHWKSIVLGITVSVGTSFLELVTDFYNFTFKRAMFCVAFGVITFFVKYKRSDTTSEKTEITDTKGNTVSVEITTEKTPIQ